MDSLSSIGICMPTSGKRAIAQVDGFLLSVALGVGGKAACQAEIG